MCGVGPPSSMSSMQQALFAWLRLDGSKRRVSGGVCGTATPSAMPSRGSFGASIISAMKADECAALVEPNPNPRKMEPVHEMRGVISLLQGDYAEAVSHFEQGNPDNLYTKYQLALAHEGAGNATEARQLFGELADNNFNSVAFALVRQEAMQKR